MNEIFSKTISAPVGFLKLQSTKYALLSILFIEEDQENSRFIPEILLQTEQQLKEYFSGQRQKFDLKLAPEGSDFQKKVWDLLKEIPYGSTTTYNKLALKLGSATYTRAVGMANSKNPIPIIIPCHRVIGANGKLVGFAGGIHRKKQLLLHELNLVNNHLLF